MTKDTGRIGIVLSALLTLVLLSVAPAAAGATELVPSTHQPKSTNTSSNTSHPNTQAGSGSTTVNPGGPNQPATGTVQPHPLPVVTVQQTQTEVSNFQQQGNAYLTQLRKKQNPQPKSQTQTAAARQKRCESLQTVLNKRISAFNKDAQTHLATVNSVFTKIQAYATKENVSTSAYTSLVATANTEATNATQAVDALKSVSVTINCSEADPASSLSTIKAAVDSTRTALQAYQKAVAAVISYLEANVKQQ